MDTKMDMRDNLEKYRKLELLLSFCKQFPKAHVLLRIFLWGKGVGGGVAKSSISQCHKCEITNTCLDVA